MATTVSLKRSSPSNADIARLRQQRAGRDRQALKGCCQTNANSSQNIMELLSCGQRAVSFETAVATDRRLDTRHEAATDQQIII